MCDKRKKEINPKNEVTRYFVYMYVHFHMLSYGQRTHLTRTLNTYFPWSLYTITLVSHTCTCIVKKIIKYRELCQLIITTVTIVPNVIVVTNNSKSSH